MAKIAKKIAQGRWADIKSRAYEELVVRRRELKHYQTGKLLFTPELFPHIFSQSFLAKYFNGKDVDFTRVLGDRSTDKFFSGFSDIPGFRSFVEFHSCVDFHCCVGYRYRGAQ